LLVPASSHE
jgi:hypothetical protein